MGRTWLAGLTVALLAATLLVATVDDYGLTFDEPLYIVITDGLRGWFADVAAGGLGGLREQLRDERLRETWLFAARQNRNLPVPVLLSALFRPLGEGWPGPPYSYRLGTCLLLAATVALLFAGLAPAHGWEMAAVAAGSLLLMPQAFAHGHLAANDVAVSSFWLLAILLWLWSGTSARRALVAALVCGLGLACKASFVLVPALLGLWLLCFRQWRRWRATLVLAVVAPLVMLALCPMWWGDPLPRIARFYWRAFNASQHWTSDSYYLGTSYLGALPWHNGLVLPAVTTPPWTLALALGGGCAAAIPSSRSGRWARASCRSFACCRTRPGTTACGSCCRASSALLPSPGSASWSSSRGSGPSASGWRRGSRWSLPSSCWGPKAS